MKDTEKIKANAMILQEKIKALFSEFYKENGNCIINVSTEGVFHEYPDGSSKLINTNVDIDIII